MALLDWVSCMDLYVKSTPQLSDRQAAVQHHRKVFTMKSAISFFTEGLRDPMHPKVCALSLLGTMFRMRSEQDGFTGGLKPSLQLFDYFNTAIALLMSPNAPEDIDALISRMSPCSCKMALSSQSFYAHLNGFLFMGFAAQLGWTPRYHATVLVAMMLRDASDALRCANMDKTLQGEQVKRWPNSIDTFFPSGLRKGVRCLAWWQKALKVEPASLVFTLAALRLCGDPLSYEVRNSSEFRDALLSTLGEIVAHVRDKKDSPDEIVFNEWRISSVTEILVAAANCTWEHQLLTDWFYGEFGATLNNLLLDAALLFVNIDEKKISSQNLMEFMEHKRTFVSFALLTSEKLPMSGSQSSQWAKISGYLLNPSTLADFDPAGRHSQVVANYLNYMKGGRCCLNEGCTAIIGTGHGNMWICSSCKVVRYCSKGCQRQDWKHRRFPHKTVCGQIHIFSRACGGRLPDIYEVRDMTFNEEIGRDAANGLWRWIQSRQQLYGANRYEPMLR